MKKKYLQNISVSPLISLLLVYENKKEPMEICPYFYPTLNGSCIVSSKFAS